MGQEAAHADGEICMCDLATPSDSTGHRAPLPQTTPRRRPVNPAVRRVCCIDQADKHYSFSVVLTESCEPSSPSIRGAFRFAAA
jgi:hypothetical protein